MANTERSRDTRWQDAAMGRAIAARLAGTIHSRISLAVFLGLTTVAVVAEPFGTGGALSLVPRVLYWAIVVSLSIVAGAVFDEIAQKTAPPSQPWQAPVRASALMALGYTPIVVLVSHVFKLFGAGLTAYPPLVFLYTLVVSMTVYGLVYVVRPHLREPLPDMPVQNAPEAEAQAEPAPMPEIALLRPRLAHRLACPDVTIFRVSASDHLTEVATEHGIERIRMRFADAVIEMEPVVGTCVHRSHWVALDAVTGIVRREGKPFVQLANGEELPVSRTYRPRLEEAVPGLF